MKLLLIACLIGLTTADFLQDAVPAIDESVRAFIEGAASAGSLSEVLGLTDPELDQMTDDLESELGEKIRESLNEMLEKIKDYVDNGKAVSHELIEKVKELRDKLRDLGEGKGERVKEMLKIVREKAKEALRKILERLGLGKRNLDDSMDQLARMKFRELIEKIRDRILSMENIKKIRDYILDREGESPIVKRLKELVERLSDVELRDIISHFFDYHHQSGEKKKKGEAWDKVKSFLKDINIKIQDHTRKFGKWVKEMWDNGMDGLKEKHGTVKTIAMEFIANSKDMSAEVTQEALEFFRPYKEELGVLWDQIVDATREGIGKF